MSELVHRSTYVRESLAEMEARHEQECEDLEQKIAELMNKKNRAQNESKAIQIRFDLKAQPLSHCEVDSLEMSLHDSCESGDTLAASALVERGASVNEKDHTEWTPLYYTCHSGRSATAIALLENGAVSLNDRNTFGSTPSYWVCLKCTADVVLRMIQHGAILTTAEIQRFRDQPAITEEQARIVESDYNREEARALCHIPVEHKRPGGCGANGKSVW